MSKQLKILVGSVVVSLVLYGQLNATTSTTSNAKLQITEPDALALHIERLVWYESNGRTNFRIVDTNGEYSYSCLQFQEATFNQYSKRYGIQGDIYDCEFQKLLARKMLEERYDNWKHWKLTHLRKTGLPPVSKSS